MTYDVVIIGAGPAGLTAAIYCGRSKLNTLIISPEAGGQTALAGSIENFPGIESIEGKKLIENMLAHTKKQKSITEKIGIDNSIIKIEKNNKGYSIYTQNNNRYDSTAVLITAGKTAKKLSIPGEKEFEGRGVSFCATCDAPLFRNKIVTVVGGGYSATEATYMLSKYASKIYVLTINEKLMGEAITQDKILKLKKILVVPFAHATKIINDGRKVTAIEYRDSHTNEIKSIKCDGVFIEIGSIPNTNPYQGILKLNRWGEIIINEKNATNMPGIFGAGDITDVWGKQTIIAAGEGAKAAMAVSEYISRNR